MSNVLLNFRDISENCDVKSGIIYRGRALIINDMSDEDKAFIDSLKIRHIIDLRGNGGGANIDRQLLFGDLFSSPFN